MRTYYELLGIASSVPADEIKRAFRREIARYHPDKVQHLGSEFQDIAAVRASELTEAYRVLMDTAARRAYDQSLAAGAAGPQGAPPPANPSPASTPEPAPPRETPHLDSIPPLPDRRFQQERASTSHFVRRATLSRLREAVAAVAGSAVPVAGCEFDLAVDMNGRGGLFKRADPLRLLAQFVKIVDAATVELHWVPAIKASKGADLVCVLLLGAGGMAPARDLSLAVADQRRKTRAPGPILVPVDVRDWDALFPPEAPASVRAIVQWLKQKV